MFFLSTAVAMADNSSGFPPPSYSTSYRRFLPALLKAAGEKRPEFAEFFKSKNSEKKNNKKWKLPKNFLEKRKKDTTESRNNNKIDKHSLEDENKLLKILAESALDLTVPASDALLKNRRNNWVQLSGHEGAFAVAGPDTIWKRRTYKDDSEVKAYKQLMLDVMSDIVPNFYKEVEWNGEYYIEMEDLLHKFKDPSVMDIKMGIRTFSEMEIKNQTARHDLYQKMIKLDPKAATEEERSNEAVTKLRYMTFREQQSSSSTLGFRIEAMKLKGSDDIKDLKLVRTWDEVLNTMNQFLAGYECYQRELLRRLQDVRDRLEKSEFFKIHEVIGSSILIVMDSSNIGAWMIDFAKTFPLPDNITINHRSPWSYGNHEDGYLFGLDNLIQVIENVNCKAYASHHKVHYCQENLTESKPSSSTS